MQCCVFYAPDRLHQRHCYRRYPWTPLMLCIAVLVCLSLGATPTSSRLLKSCSTGGPAPDYRHTVRDNWAVVSRLFGRYLDWSPTPDSGKQLKKAMLQLSDVPDERVQHAVDSVNDNYRERYLAWLDTCKPQTLGR